MIRAGSNVRDGVTNPDPREGVPRPAGQCYNAQALVDTETVLGVVPQVVQAANDKQQVVAMLEKVRALPQGLNQPERVLADTG